MIPTAIMVLVQRAPREEIRRSTAAFADRPKLAVFTPARQQFSGKIAIVGKAGFVIPDFGQSPVPNITLNENFTVKGSTAFYVANTVDEDAIDSCLTADPARDRSSPSPNIVLVFVIIANAIRSDDHHLALAVLLPNEPG